MRCVGILVLLCRMGDRRGLQSVIRRRRWEGASGSGKWEGLRLQPSCRNGAKKILWGRRNQTGAPDRGGAAQHAPLPGGVMVTQGILVPSFKVRVLAG